MTANKVPLHVEKIGSRGYPLVMLHGWGQSIEHLKPLAELLALEATVYLIDLPGFGLSETPQEVWSAFDYAVKIQDYLMENQIGHADFFGHSFGGKVAICVAIKFPERVRKLILAAPSGLRKHRTLLQQCRFLSIKGAGKVIKTVDRLLGTKLFTTHFISKYGSVDYQKAGEMRRILVRSVNEDLSADIETIKKPTLLLWGEKDSETPLEMAFRLQKKIATSRLVPFPNKGHHFFEGVGAHLCAYHILPFLEGKSCP